jgi:hypothetical protein
MCKVNLMCDCMHVGPVQDHWKLCLHITACGAAAALAAACLSWHAWRWPGHGCACTPGCSSALSGSRGTTAAARRPPASWRTPRIHRRSRARAPARIAKPPGGRLLDLLLFLNGVGARNASHATHTAQSQGNQAGGSNSVLETTDPWSPRQLCLKKVRFQRKATATRMCLALHCPAAAKKMRAAAGQKRKPRAPPPKAPRLF